MDGFFFVGGWCVRGRWMGGDGFLRDLDWIELGWVG